MRVIAGTYRSRPLAAPRGLSTRPTSDRLRETLFNVLSQRIAGALFADLYAGSGAVGIEAISRGANEVLFAEKSAPAVAAIRGNLRALTIGKGFQIEAAGVATLLKRQAGKPMDIVFLDPPYEEAEEYRKTLASLGDPAEELLHADSLVIAEHLRKQPLADRYGVLRRTRTLLQSDAALSFYAVEAEEPEPLPDLVE
jgi:16S rRNA (guanine966-N2)-methyltransferase